MTLLDGKKYDGALPGRRYVSKLPGKLLYTPKSRTYIRQLI
jgi:hypothetical protein